MPATATRTRRSKKSVRRKISIDQLRSICLKPTENRRQLPIGRNGKLVTPRNNFLSDEDVARLKELHAAGDPFPNPQNKAFYYYLIESLKELGLNEAHTQAKVQAKFRDLTNTSATKVNGETFWRRWKNRTPRSKKNSLPWEGRFMQNVRVLQRLTGANPYGMKIMDVGTKVLGTAGAVIDILPGGSGGHLTMIRLNTNSATPLKITNETADSESAE